MNFISKKIKDLYLDLCQYIGASYAAPSRVQIQLTLFVVGIALLTTGLSEASFAQASALDGEVETERLDMAAGAIFKYLEGSFGVLVMVVSGLGAILAAAFGQYRAALGCLVVAVGAFILRAFVMTFFNTEGISNYWDE